MFGLENIGTPGTWFGLPDLGFTEARGIGTGPNWQNPLIPFAQKAEPTPPPTPPPTPIYTPVPNASSGGSSYAGTVPGTTVPSGGTPQPQTDYEAQMKAAIESGYSGYFNQLDTVLNQGLPAQKTAQEGIVQGQYQTGLTDITGQQTAGTADLATQKRLVQEQQVKSLKDISGNIRNQMLAGNVYLGARGAGDSSAANQYAYALTKLGSQARGNVMGQTSSIMNDIADREFKLNNIFNTESNKLKSDYDTKINSVAQWYADAQNQIRQMQAQGAISKGKDLAAISQQMLSYAMQQLQTVQAAFTNQQSALQSWAMTRAQDITQLKQNMAAITANYNPQINAPGAINVAGNMFGGGTTPTAYVNPYTGSTTEKKYNPLTGQYE